MYLEVEPISDFFAGSVVLLTGASGFLGRMCLEKLLRTCPDLKKVYIVLRPKKEKDTAKRIDDILNSLVFERLRKEQPDFAQKIGVLTGDCCLPDLGLMLESKEVVLKQCNVIIHWAATVKFDENIKTATAINVRAVRDLIRMAKNMPQLKAFLHVSTAFSNCPHTNIDEIFYDTPIAGNDLVQMMEALDAKTAAEVTKPLLGRWPNTYVFTKAVAENLIRTEARGLPFGIIRPSIVLGSYRDPVPGWIDNYYGATGILLGCAVGLMRVIYTDLDCTAEMVPADYVVNAAIASLPDIRRRYDSMLRLPDPKSLLVEQAIPIYNYVSSTQKGITWETFMKLSHKHCVKIPSPVVIWHSSHFATANPILYKLAIFFLHIIPAYIFDFGAMCLGKKPMLVKGYEKIHKFGEVLAYFSCRSWLFHNSNVQLLWTHLPDVDKKRFDFNMGSFIWDDYFQHYVLGARLYLLKDPIDTIPAGRRKYWKLKIAHYALVTFLLYALYKLSYIFLQMVFGK